MLHNILYKGSKTGASGTLVQHWALGRRWYRTLVPCPYIFFFDHRWTKVQNETKYVTFVMDACTISDPPPLRLTHYGKKEVLALISLLEPKWDEPMTFGDNRGPTDTTPADTPDPSQQWGVVSTKKKPTIPLALQNKQTPESDGLGLENDYEYKRLLWYLKTNNSDPDRPYKTGEVSERLH